MIVSASCEAQVEKFAKIPALKPQQRKPILLRAVFGVLKGL